MDYTIRYGLEFNPFLKNSKEIFVSTDESKEVLFRLDYLAKTKGFGLLTGSPGRGKTTAVRYWAQTLNPSQYKVVYTCFSTFSPNDFYRNLATELGAQAHYRKPDRMILSYCLTLRWIPETVLLFSCQDFHHLMPHVA